MIIPSLNLPVFLTNVPHWIACDYFNFAIQESVASHSRYRRFFIGRKARNTLWFCNLYKNWQSQNFVNVAKSLQARKIVHDERCTKTKWFDCKFVKRFYVHSTQGTYLKPYLFKYSNPTNGMGSNCTHRNFWLRELRNVQCTRPFKHLDCLQTDCTVTAVVLLSGNLSQHQR